MKVFVLPGWYKSEEYPENCIFVYEQIQELRKIGNEAIVLSVKPISIKSQIKKIKSIRCVNDNGVLTYYKDVTAIYPSKFRRLYIRSFRNAAESMLKRAIKEHGRPDVLYAHFSFPAGAAAVGLAQKFKLPLVTEEHYSGLMNPQIDSSLLKCVKDTINGSKSLIAVSSGLKESIEKKLGTDQGVTVISNMICDVFQYKKPIPHNGFTFFSCGALIPRKGFVELINAFAEVFADDKDVFLRIGGSGEQKALLQNLIDECGMSGRISLLGQLSRDMTLAEYQNCDCFVLPSKAETYGLVYREALAVGRPVISTMHGGFGDTDWHDDYGVLIPVDDKNALCNALRHIYTGYSKYDLERISRLCLEECSADNIANRITKVLMDATDKV